MVDELPSPLAEQPSNSHGGCVVEVDVQRLGFEFSALTTTQSRRKLLNDGRPLRMAETDPVSPTRLIGYLRVLPLRNQRSSSVTGAAGNLRPRRPQAAGT
jgi:hypothetical protein